MRAGGVLLFTFLLTASWLAALWVAMRIHRNFREHEKTKAKLQAISDSALDAIIMMDPKGNAAHWNPAAQKMFGYSSEEIMGHSIHGILTPGKHRKQAYAGHENFVNSGTGAAVGKVLELEAQQKDGSTFPIQIAMSPIKLEDQWWAVAIIRDITEQKHADNELRQSESRFRDVVMSMSDWIWETDPEGVCTYCSEQVEKSLGYKNDELIGKTPFDFMPTPDAEHVEKMFRTTVAKRLPIKDFENRNIAKDGSEVVFLTNALPILDDQGNVVGYRGVNKDITKRKRAEEKVANAHRDLMSVINASSHVSIIAIDQQGTITLFNSGAEKMLGYSREEDGREANARHYTP